MITAKDALAADLAKHSPATIKSASIADLTAVAQTVRTFLIGSRTATDHRLGVNLSYVELTLALHRAFDWPGDRVIFDGGHQMDAHRIVTGRVDRFHAPPYDPSGRVVFKAEGSPDVIEAVRGGTSISVALGMALARALTGDARPVVAVVGDGALAQCVALDALAHAASVPHVNLIVVLNDNGDTAAAGALQSYLQTLAPDRREPEPFFTAIGLDYVGPVDGHHLDAVARALERARTSTQIPLVHVKTQKWHGTRPPVATPRDPASRPRYVDVAAAVVSGEMARDERLVLVVVPAPTDDSGFATLLTRLPDRAFAPRLDDAHGLAMSVGLAAERYRPVIVAGAAVLDHRFDRWMRDICASGAPAIVLAVGAPAATKSWPDASALRVLAPTGRAEYERVLRDTLRDASGPTLIVTPAGPAA